MAAEIIGHYPAPPSGDTDRFADVRDLSRHEIRSEQNWPVIDGVAVNPDIPEYLLTQFPINPVADPNVPGLGGVTLRSVRSTADSQGLPRYHRMYSIALDGFRFACEVTEPAQGAASYAIGSFPGFTETIEGRYRQDIHNSMSHYFPEARIISIGSNGIGNNGDHFGFNERSLHGLEEMGIQRLGLLRALAGDLIVISNGTSMGTVVEHRMGESNLQDITPIPRIDHRGQLLLSPALVDPRAIPTSMATIFPPQLLKDLFLDLALKTPLNELGHIIQSGREYGLSRRDVVSMVHQAYELLHGTSEKRVLAVVQEVPTVVVAGENDCLAQWKMWKRIGKVVGDNLVLAPIKGRGHTLPIHGDKACNKIYRTGKDLVARALAA